MSKRKNRERFAALKTDNPAYQGFRGYGVGSPTPSPEALITLTCSVCGRRRNVTQEVAREQGDAFVCLSCREEAEEAGGTVPAADGETVSSL